MTKRTIQTSVSNRRRAAQMMKRILIGFRTQMDEELRPRGVTTAELQILKAVQSRPGSSGAQLARVCYMTPQSMQTLIQRTEAEGWIERHKGKGNERVLAASLTAAGEALLKDADETVRRIEKRVWKGVPDDEIQALVAVLERCLGNMADE